jgi:prepilin-type N-terminal cleavage/methylation domain-containing protein
MQRGRGLRDRPSARAGFSIVEVLVALVLVTVGLLGIAGNCALAIRVTGAAARERRAAQRASDRIADLTSQGCALARSGSSPTPSAGMSEQWAVGAVVNGVALVDARVSWAAPTGPRSVLLRSATLC